MKVIKAPLKLRFMQSISRMPRITKALSYHTQMDKASMIPAMMNEVR